MQFSNVIQQLFEWMKSLALQYTYFGIFLISLIGALSIIFPIPYTVIGVESDWVSALIGMALAITLLIIVFILMFKVDWEKRFEKYTQKKG